MNRRHFLLGLGAIAAPAVIRTPGLLMPVKRIVTSVPPWPIPPGPLSPEVLAIMSQIEKYREEIEQMTGVPKMLAQSMASNKYIASVMALARDSV